MFKKSIFLIIFITFFITIYTNKAYANEIEVVNDIGIFSCIVSPDRCFEGNPGGGGGGGEQNPPYDPFENATYIRLSDEIETNFNYLVKKQEYKYFKFLANTTDDIYININTDFPVFFTIYNQNRTVIKEGVTDKVFKIYTTLGNNIYIKINNIYNSAGYIYEDNMVKISIVESNTLVDKASVCKYNGNTMPKENCFPIGDLNIFNTIYSEKISNTKYGTWYKNPTTKIYFDWIDVTENYQIPNKSQVYEYVKTGRYAYIQHFPKSTTDNTPSYNEVNYLSFNIIAYKHGNHVNMQINIMLSAMYRYDFSTKKLELYQNYSNLAISDVDFMLYSSDIRFEYSNASLRTFDLLRNQGGSYPGDVIFIHTMKTIISDTPIIGSFYESYEFFNDLLNSFKYVYIVESQHKKEGKLSFGMINAATNTHLINIDFGNYFRASKSYFKYNPYDPYREETNFDTYSTTFGFNLSDVEKSNNLFYKFSFDLELVSRDGRKISDLNMPITTTYWKYYI